MKKFFVFFCLLWLSGCSSWRVVPSRAVHQRAQRSQYTSSVPTKGTSLIARDTASLKKGQPLAYELGQARFTWPVSAAAVSSLYGQRWGRPHEGIDIAVPTGTPVKAARAGKVIYAENRISGYGKMVIIKHSPNFATVYAHLSRIGVRVGDFVERGKAVGRSGMTGRATSPHLHFEIRHQRMAVDPLVYLPGRVASAR